MVALLLTIATQRPCALTLNGAPDHGDLVVEKVIAPGPSGSAVGFLSDGALLIDGYRPTGGGSDILIRYSLSNWHVVRVAAMPDSRRFRDAAVTDVEPGAGQPRLLLNWGPANTPLETAVTKQSGQIVATMTWRQFQAAVPGGDANDWYWCGPGMVVAIDGDTGDMPHAHLFRVGPAGGFRFVGDDRLPRWLDLNWQVRAFGRGLLYVDAPQPDSSPPTVHMAQVFVGAEMRLRRLALKVPDGRFCESADGAASPDGRWVACWNYDIYAHRHYILVFNAGTGVRVASIELPLNPQTCVWSPDCRRLAVTALVPPSQSPGGGKNGSFAENFTGRSGPGVPRIYVLRLRVPGSLRRHRGGRTHGHG
ncbi:MAG: hypothetical protein KGK12_03850 [Armatimonadetes bacterium]|nr:hypothetical protein [Armatimonadota bacterium]